MSENAKKILYIDMDNVLVDFTSGKDLLHTDALERYDGDLDEVPGIFATMTPVEGAVEAFVELSKLFDSYILSTAPWRNPSAWSDKVMWVQRYFGTNEGSPAYKRLILSHNKNLNHGDTSSTTEHTTGSRTSPVNTYISRLIPFPTGLRCLRT